MVALVLDDSRAMRAILRRMLEGMGYGVVEAADGREGLDRLAAGARPDVMLVDWNMPVMNGLEFLKVVRASAELKDVPVMMVTTETEMSQVVRALECGASEYLMKPFDREVLAEKLCLMGFEPA
jgi:two-component system chemotaxis response regulator CheY